MENDKKLFIMLSGIYTDKNVDFVLMTEKEIEKAEEEAEDIYEYLTCGNYENWCNIPITEHNIEKVKSLLLAMENEFSKQDCLEKEKIDE